jgi:hypothetical protein
VLYPHSPFCHVARLGGHKRAQTSIGPSQSPSRSETARPVGRASAWGEGFGIPNRSPDPWYEGWAEIIPFRYLPVLLGGKGTLHVGWDTGDLPSQGEKLRASNPIRSMFAPRRNAWPPHFPSPPRGGTLSGRLISPHPLGVARSPSRGLASSSSCRSACGDSVPPHPLGWHALRAGASYRHRRVVSCRSACGACGACTKSP